MFKKNRERNYVNIYLFQQSSYQFGETVSAALHRPLSCCLVWIKLSCTKTWILVLECALISIFLPRKCWSRSHILIFSIFLASATSTDESKDENSFISRIKGNFKTLKRRITKIGNQRGVWKILRLIVFTQEILINVSCFKIHHLRHSPFNLTDEKQIHSPTESKATLNLLLACHSGSLLCSDDLKTTMSDKTCWDT